MMRLHAAPQRGLPMAVLAAAGVWLAVAADRPLPVEEVALRAEVQLAVQAREARENLLVLDQSNHHLLFFAPDGRLLRRLGQIGQRAGEFFSPEAFALDRHSNVYVKDGSNRRIQAFDWNGKFLSEFPDTPKSIGLAVDSKGEILLGQPHLGKLVTVYDRKGGRLRDFGELKKLSDFYGQQVADMDAQFKYAVNRVRICVDAKDNVYLVFQAAPFFQKYDAAGRLVFEARIEGSEADGILEGYRSQRKAPGRSTIDNVAIPRISSGIAVHDQTGNIFIAFHWASGWIYAADPQGRPLATLEPEKRALFSELSFSEDGTSLLTTRVAMNSNTVYSLKLPHWLVDSAH